MHDCHSDEDVELYRGLIFRIAVNKGWGNWLCRGSNLLTLTQKSKHILLLTVTNSMRHFGRSGENYQLYLYMYHAVFLLIKNEPKGQAFLKSC